MKRTCLEFARDESGSVTLDWVALTASVVVVGIGLVYSVFGDGDAPLNEIISTYNAELDATAADLSTIVPDASNIKFGEPETTDAPDGLQTAE